MAGYKEIRIVYNVFDISFMSGLFISIIIYQWLFFATLCCCLLVLGIEEVLDLLLRLTFGFLHLKQDVHKTLLKTSNLGDFVLTTPLRAAMMSQVVAPNQYLIM